MSYEEYCQQHSGNEYVFDINPALMVRKNAQENPLDMIDRLEIQDTLKPLAKNIYEHEVEQYDFSKKDLNAGVFFAIYCATRRLNIPVDLQTIARACSIGLEKYPEHVQNFPFDTWIEEAGTPNEREMGGGKVSLSPQRIGKIISTYISEGFDIDMSPPDIYAFMKQEIEIQDLQEHKRYILEFTRNLLKDEYWDDQPPNNLSIAILQYLSRRKSCPFYNHQVRYQPWISPNVIMRLVDLLDKEDLPI